jgi:hypothetical protein
MLGSCIKFPSQKLRKVEFFALKVRDATAEVKPLKLGRRPRSVRLSDIACRS